MMQAFRNAAKPVAYLITAAFLLWMLVDLSGLSGGGGVLTKTTVGSINGQSVDARIYSEAVQRAVTARQQETGRSLGLEEVDQVRNEVWEQFIQNAVLEAEVKRRNLGVSPDEIATLIRNVPPPEVQSSPDFQTDGQFDLTKYQRWLASAVGQQAIPFLEARYRDEILRAKLLRNVTADIFLSDAALWERYRDAREATSIALTPIIARNIIPDSAVDVTPAEVDAYYKANTKEFERPRTAFLSFIGVSRMLDASDSAAALGRVTAIRSELLAGASFADVAQRESGDPGSAQLGGDLGTFGRGDMIPPFENAAFTIPLNTVSEPVLTVEGYHLIEVSARTADSVTARHILVRMELAGQHRDLVDAMADSLEALAADRLDPAALDTAARALRLPIGQTAPIQEGTRAVVGDLLVGDAGVWAFQAKVGETSPVVETAEAFFVFRLDSLHKAGVPALNDIRQAVTFAVLEQKKEEMAKEVAATLIREVEAGRSMAEASAALGLPHREFPAFPRVNPPLQNPKLIGLAFGLPKGKLSGVIDTPEGLYVIRVLDRIPADSAAFNSDLDAIRAEAIRTARNERVRYFLQALRDGAKVKDERAETFRTTAQAEAEAAALGVLGGGGF
jgi:peptidyl-prolyl cis-trans isomerase D